MTALGFRMLAALATSLLLVLVGLGAFPRAQKPGSVTAPQWEYKIVSNPPRGDVPIVERLNREGANGWELVDCITADGGIFGMVFNRIKPAAE